MREMSENNEYYLDKHRKCELMHFCKQYKKWQEALADVQGWVITRTDEERVDNKGYVSDPTARAAAIRKFYSDRIGMIEKAAYEADPTIARYLIKGATEDVSYDNLRLMHMIPCSKETYYNRLQKFFWILDKKRK